MLLNQQRRKLSVVSPLLVTTSPLTPMWGRQLSFFHGERDGETEFFWKRRKNNSVQLNGCCFLPLLEGLRFSILFLSTSFLFLYRDFPSTNEEKRTEGIVQFFFFRSLNSLPSWQKATTSHFSGSPPSPTQLHLTSTGTEHEGGEYCSGMRHKTHTKKKGEVKQNVKSTSTINEKKEERREEHNKTKISQQLFFFPSSSLFLPPFFSCVGSALREGEIDCK